MFRAQRRVRSPLRPAQLFAVVLTVLFVLSIDGVVPQPADAGSYRSQMAATRRSQVRAASVMLRADKKVRRLKRAEARSRKQAAAAAKRLHKVEKKRRKVQARLKGALDRLELATMDRDRKLRVHPDPRGVQVADQPKLRQRVGKLRTQMRVLDRRVARLQGKARRTQKVMKSRAKAVRRLKRKVARKIKRRERSETRLGSSIKQMVALAEDRAASEGLPRPAKAGLRRPVKGHITQGYGCLRRKHGQCLRFHDGIDIAARRGTTVRASATGYVAYVGWNPWDQQKRAFIVIIGHAGGYETVYAHLLPVRLVHAGQRVTRGQAIGRVGSTGHSTGPHVHWELSRGLRTIDPRSLGR